MYAVLGLLLQRSCVKWFNGECVSSWQYNTLQTKGIVSGYSNVYVAIVAGHIQEGERNTHIRKGGRNVQKHK